MQLVVLNDETVLIDAIHFMQVCFVQALIDLDKSQLEHAEKNYSAHF